MSWWFRQPVMTKILIGMALGFVAGLVYPPIGNLKWIGDIFIKVLQVVIVPLVFAALVVAMANLGDDLGKLGRIAGKTLLFYMGTTIIAITVGVLTAVIIQPGVGLDPATIAKLGQPQKATAPGFSDVMVSFFPSNIVDSMAKGMMLHVVLFAITFGLIVGQMGKKGQPIKDLMDSLWAAMIKMIWWIMELAPYGVFALMAWLISQTGLQALVPLAKYLIGTIVAIVLQTAIVVSLAVWLVGRVNPIQFYKRSFDAALVAFTTRSSNASLPVALQVAEEKLGIRPEIGGFTLPLGASMNQDGTAIWFPIAAMFIAQFYGLSVSVPEIIQIWFLVLVIGLGSTGIPSGGLIMLAMILTNLGWPVEGIALIVAVDAIPDAFRTCLNVVDDLCGAVMVAGSEKGMLDRDVFYGRKVLAPEELTYGDLIDAAKKEPELARGVLDT